ncbi:eukaryotic aspartyl protease domain-containing protein [Ditylenchus destructor]|uniref:Eukaryotic aspartyl protease domain-containing protein n=1 Tax=Ditylenchus destructor TaxID=166010 RepID=A0AAD4QW06_9BILA|nr:eukaryotic aspartyl protease domain-containing protein [Ditylenchus destructor]
MCSPEDHAARIIGPLLILIISVATSQQDFPRQFHASRTRIPPELARIRLERLNHRSDIFREFHSQLPEVGRLRTELFPKKVLANCTQKSTGRGGQTSQWERHVTRTFSVEIDPHDATEMSIINCTYSRDKTDHCYNSSTSSTYTFKDGNFTEGYDTGHKASDVVNLGGANFTLDFGVFDRPYAWHSSLWNWINGALGLSASNNSYSPNNASLLTQLVGQMDRPIVTYHTNGTENRTMTVSFGSYDPENCADDWVYAPNTDGYDSHVSSASAIVKGKLVTVSLNATLHGFLSYGSISYMPTDMYKLIFNASGSQPPSVRGYVACSCNVSKIPNITINLDIGNNKTVPLLFTGSEYVNYNSYHQLCYFAIDRENKYNKGLILTTNFWRNRCFSYNIKKGLVGFATARDRIIDPTTRYK